MNKDIQTLIEREALQHAKSTKILSDYRHCERSHHDGFKAGSQFALSLFKWRKVSEELPEVKNEAYPVLVYRKYKKEEYKMDTL